MKKQEAGRFCLFCNRN